ncbi:dTMP kinase [Legionella sp. W05-934-2]|jgi:dTMP kinase|uniref:dTMP kinase n=1 Tax=Legionella sp. W05-934-2 TaxID=1198649 RepID=UPI0034629A28
MSTQGHYIVVEGLEGAGKSSAITTICSVLQQHQIGYHTAREPGGTPIAEAIRSIIKGNIDHEVLSAETELLLMYAARKQLLEHVISPKLRAGTWVVSDRNEWSSISYQGYGRGMSLQFIKQLSDFTVGDIKPDLILYLDVEPELGLIRAGQRGTYDRIEQESKAFFERVHNGYKQLIADSDRARVISASLPIQQVQNAITMYVTELIKRVG